MRPARDVAFKTPEMNLGCDAWPRAFGAPTLGRNCSSSRLAMSGTRGAKAGLNERSTRKCERGQGCGRSVARSSSATVPCKHMCRHRLARTNVPRPFILPFRLSSPLGVVLPVACASSAHQPVTVAALFDVDCRVEGRRTVCEFGDRQQEHWTPRRQPAGRQTGCEPEARAGRVPPSVSRYGPRTRA